VRSEAAASGEGDAEHNASNVNSVLVDHLACGIHPTAATQNDDLITPRVTRVMPGRDISP